MKRTTLVARAQFLHEKQEALANAAMEFAKHENNSAASPHQRQYAQREMNNAGIAYGLACKRYLGGRTE